MWDALESNADARLPDFETVVCVATGAMSDITLRGVEPADTVGSACMFQHVVQKEGSYWASTKLIP
jgi:hypothetical protein